MGRRKKSPYLTYDEKMKILHETEHMEMFLARAVHEEWILVILRARSKENNDEFRHFSTSVEELVFDLVDTPVNVRTYFLLGQFMDYDKIREENA